MDVFYSPIVAEKPHSVFLDFAVALEGMDPESSIIRGGFAYATIGGVQAMLESVRAAENWAEAPKQFLVGLHHAITEPAAISMLGDSPNSEVRVFIPGRRLTARAFEASPVFHAKVLCISEGGLTKFVKAGSTNLTRAAVGPTPRNHEFAFSVHDDEQGVDLNAEFDTWWDELWTQSRSVDRRLLRNYAGKRRRVFDANPILAASTDVPSNVGEARFFFSEVGAASGPPGARHQVEFPASLVRFFGKPQKARRDLTLQNDHGEWSERPLSYKRTTFEVDIWRLGMPTQTTGGPPIANRAIRFERGSEPNAFKFEVSDVGSDEFEEWMKEAHRRGHLGATGGPSGRRYGFY